MVILSCAIIQGGKPLLSRQFSEMPKAKVDSLMTSFFKAVEATRKDHTYVETEHVRFVYKPIDYLYLLLVTTKDSNIMEDIGTLKLLYEVISTQCNGDITEDSVSKHSFRIVFAIDEVISFGYRESVTLEQIDSYLKMNSYEEEIQLSIQRRKMEEAQEEAKRVQAEIKKRAAHGIANPGSISSADFVNVAPPVSSHTQSFTAPPDSTPVRSSTKSPVPSAETNSGAAAMVDATDLQTTTNIFGNARTVNKAAKAPKKGLSLSKKKAIDLEIDF